MQILMIRHGRTDWNEVRRIQGRTDIPLNDRGRAEQKLRSIPPHFHGSPVWSSPLCRATETASLMGCPAPATDDRLIEMDFGEWEGRTHTELTAKDPQQMQRLESRGIDMRPPGGETPREVGARLLSLVGELAGPAHVLFCHKGVIRAALALALDWDMRSDLPFRVNWNAGQVFEWHDGRLTLAEPNVDLATS